MKKTQEPSNAHNSEQPVSDQNTSAKGTNKESQTKKVQDSLKHTANINDSSTEAPVIKTMVYNIGEIVPTELQEQLKIVEGLELLYSEKKDRRFFLYEMTKPISREQRKLGKKSPLTAAKRKSAKMEIRHLDKEIFSLEENHRTAMGYLTRLVNAGKTSVDLQIIRSRAASQYYMSRNKNYILSNLLKTITFVYSNPQSKPEDRNQVNDLVKASRESGAKAIRDFQDMFIEFLRKYKQELAILFTGKEWFKKEATTKVKKALSNWNPRSNELSF